MCSGLHRPSLAVFMNTPGTYRLFLIKDIKRRALPEPGSTCFRHFHNMCCRCVQRVFGGWDNIRAAFITTSHLSEITCQLWKGSAWVGVLSISFQTCLVQMWNSQKQQHPERPPRDKQNHWTLCSSICVMMTRMVEVQTILWLRQRVRWVW